MKKTVIFLLVCTLAGGLLASPAGAVPGDVDGNGTVGFTDVVYLLWPGEGANTAMSLGTLRPDSKRDVLAS